ncbi:MAG: VWA domain-containing protein [Okeania sp. SIO3I5]|uniref:vWA domain-containing protein n=1 Tax=Okeania sp. SIO3I5 TaxID=2607805 RepID=UPI0013B8ECB4|nr:vWA domain-containing protein [Okeania sp. SIO3I5]NEQ36804.1 VWA domain-containing protein [Okeania sp. SIO3I5]
MSNQERPLVDIFFVVDVTGSMTTAIANMKADMLNEYKLMKQMRAEWDVQIGLAWYRDIEDGANDLSEIVLSLTSDEDKITNAVNNLTVHGGGDDPEAQLLALHQVATVDLLTEWRPKSNRYISWFGDYYGKDPVGYKNNEVTIDDVIAELKKKDIKVNAFSLDPMNNLNGPKKQAEKITKATGGIYKEKLDPKAVAKAMYYEIKHTIHN